MTDGARLRTPIDLGRGVGSWGLAAMVATVTCVVRRFRSGGSRWFWPRAFGLLMLLSAPGVFETLQEIVECAAGVECCDGGSCDERGGAGCSHACTHCACCAHPKALLGSLPLLASAPAASGHTSIGRAERGFASGFRAPPFRPPLG